MLTTKITLEGNFFKRDVKKTVRANIRDMLDELAEWMGDEASSAIAGNAGSMPNWTGWTADHTKGYTTSPKTGKHWELAAAVATVTSGMTAKDAIRTKAAAVGIERRFHPFRQVKSAVYRARPLINANLTKGLE